MHDSRLRKDCECHLEYSDPDEMCDLCRDKHFDRIIDHHEFMCEQARDERLIDSLITEIFGEGSFAYK